MTINYGIFRVVSDGPAYNAAVEYKDCPEHCLFETCDDARKRALELGDEYSVQEIRIG